MYEASYENRSLLMGMVGSSTEKKQKTLGQEGGEIKLSSTRMTCGPYDVFLNPLLTPAGLPNS